MCHAIFMSFSWQQRWLSVWFDCPQPIYSIFRTKRQYIQHKISLVHFNIAYAIRPVKYCLTICGSTIFRMCFTWSLTRYKAWTLRHCNEGTCKSYTISFIMWSWFCLVYSVSSEQKDSPALLCIAMSAPFSTHKMINGATTPYSIFPIMLLNKWCKTVFPSSSLQFGSLFLWRSSFTKSL